MAVVEWKVLVPEDLERPWRRHTSGVSLEEAEAVFGQLDTSIHSDPGRIHHLPIRVVDDLGGVVRSNFS